MYVKLLNVYCAFEDERFKNCSKFDMFILHTYWTQNYIEKLHKNSRLRC